MDGLCNNFEAKLHETSAMKIKKQETAKNMEKACEKLQIKTKDLIDKRQQNKLITDGKIKLKEQVMTKLEADMTLLRKKCDEEIGAKM